jgi:hypothetical protein
MAALLQYRRLRFKDCWLTQLIVYTPRHKHIHCRHGCEEAHNRYRPRHSRMGRFDLFNTLGIFHCPISRTANALARRSHRWCPGPYSTIPTYFQLDLQAHSGERSKANHRWSDIQCRRRYYSCSPFPGTLS